MNQSFSKKNILFCCYTFVILYSILYFFIGERLPVYNGLGWDGQTYARYAQDFFGYSSTTSDAYHVSRCFPSFIIWAVCKGLKIDLNSARSIFNAFYILNTFCLLSIIFFWNRICEVKYLKTETFFFGFISFFFNFTWLKLYFYYPILTDPFAVTLAIAALYFSISKSYVFLNLLIIPTIITWPIGIVFIFILSMYIYPPTSFSSVEYKTNKWIASLVSFGYFLALVFASYSENFWQSILNAEGSTPLTNHMTTIAAKFSILSALIACLYSFFILYSMQPMLLCRNVFNLYLKNIFLYVVFLIIALILYKYLMHLSPNTVGKVSAIDKTTMFLFLFYNIPLNTLIKPGIFFTMQIVTWGPVTLMALIYCKQLFQKAYEENIGLVILLFISFYFSLNSQYRFNTFLIPFYIYLLCLVLDSMNIRFKFCLYYLLIGIVSSKIYYLINVDPISDWPSIDEFYTTSLQRYFMNTGYWVSWDGYFITAGISVIVIFSLYFLLVKYGMLQKVSIKMSKKVGDEQCN
ncbi:MAG: hypothetical protein H0T84_05810 [Tatlockia sp.]|nr:hypothetical protein [Tatlockia sp.]